jgi:Iap family predicted aminopeptidase
MTLKEKICEPFDGLKIETSNKLVKIADDYAIEFAEWTYKNYGKFSSRWVKYENNILFYYTTKELLEIFKKEKGL